MTSSTVNLEARLWHKLDTGASGSIYHKSGNTTVVYTESIASPFEFGVSSSEMQRTRVDQMFTYFGVAPHTYIYAWALNGDAKITITPAGE